VDVDEQFPVVRAPDAARETNENIPEDLKQQLRELGYLN
jgi:hypothetical protein